MARSLLFGTSVSPGIAIGVLRFAHNVQTVEMRRISPREVEGEQEQLRAAVTNVRAALQEAMANVPEDLSEYREVIAAQIELARDPKLVGSALSRIEKELVCAAWALDSTVEQLCSIFRNMDDPYLRDRAQDIRAVGLRLRECLAGSCALPAAAGAGRRHGHGFQGRAGRHHGRGRAHVAYGHFVARPAHPGPGGRHRPAGDRQAR